MGPALRDDWSSPRVEGTCSVFLRTSATSLVSPLACHVPTSWVLRACSFWVAWRPGLEVSVEVAMGFSMSLFVSFGPGCPQHKCWNKPPRQLESNDTPFLHLHPILLSPTAELAGINLPPQRSMEHFFILRFITAPHQRCVVVMLSLIVSPFHLQV